MTRRDGSATAPARRGFTLIELCVVLLIIAVLLGVMMPAFHSAFVESSMRVDARQLSFLVRSAMVQSTDEHRAYVLDLTSTSLALHPASVPAPTGDPTGNHPVTDTATPDDSGDDSTSYQFNSEDKLLIPDPKKDAAWMQMPDASWLFQPGALCPATRVRLMRGQAYVEMSFNALTGNVENEAAYFP